MITPPAELDVAGLDDVMNAVTPKGVEHFAPTRLTNCSGAVMNAVTPKGVEHDERAKARELLDRDERSDAERR
ncbi:hypothetical protein FRUB_10167 [Fimbriiglobus ruber]|uniref:Uncharacterized protein n=1 Tax=Fimbriiglobus ruber TaxID=1908690 RepID=A0A225DA75_9BACT|nr:hypothetical protein FRUB_10167 [Fimbriiglobus ruber]